MRLHGAFCGRIRAVITSSFSSRVERFWRYEYVLYSVVSTIRYGDGIDGEILSFNQCCRQSWIQWKNTEIISFTSCAVIGHLCSIPYVTYIVLKRPFKYKVDSFHLPYVLVSIKWVRFWTGHVLWLAYQGRVRILEKMLFVCHLGIWLHQIKLDSPSGKLTSDNRDVPKIESGRFVVVIQNISALFAFAVACRGPYSLILFSIMTLRSTKALQHSEATSVGIYPRLPLLPTQLEYHFTMSGTATGNGGRPLAAKASSSKSPEERLYRLLAILNEAIELTDD